MEGGDDNGIGMKAYYLQWNGHQVKMEWHRCELWKIMRVLTLEHKTDRVSELTILPHFQKD